MTGERAVAATPGSVHGRPVRARADDLACTVKQ